MLFGVLSIELFLLYNAVSGDIPEEYRLSLYM